MGLPFAKALVELGHEIEVLTGFPNYPGGEVYEGYHIRPLERETVSGIPVIRVPIYPSHDNSVVRRIATYTSFAISASLIGPWVVKAADVVHVEQGPATVGLPGCVLRLLRRIPFVYTVQDLWPDSLPSTGMFSNLLGLWTVGKWCEFVYKCSGKIVAITPGFKKRLCERGVPEDKIEVIYEWCDDSQIAHVQKNQQLAHVLGMEGRFNIVFAGNMGKAQALGAVLEAAKMLAADSPYVQFVFIGSGVEVGGLKQKATDMNLKNVLFLKRRPISEIGTVLSLGDVLLVHLKNDPLFSITIPSKTQAYMAAGRPILIGVKGDAADLVTKAKAGLVCEPENPNSIAEAIRRFLAMSQVERDAMGANGRRFYEQQLSSTIGIKRFERIFESLAKSSSPLC